MWGNATASGWPNAEWADGAASMIHMTQFDGHQLFDPNYAAVTMKESNRFHFYNSGATTVYVEFHYYANKYTTHTDYFNKAIRSFPVSHATAQPAGVVPYRANDTLLGDQTLMNWWWAEATSQPWLIDTAQPELTIRLYGAKCMKLPLYPLIDYTPPSLANFYNNAGAGAALHPQIVQEVNAIGIHAAGSGATIQRDNQMGGPMQRSRFTPGDPSGNLANMMLGPNQNTISQNRLDNNESLIAGIVPQQQNINGVIKSDPYLAYTTTDFSSFIHYSEKQNPMVNRFFRRLGFASVALKPGDSYRFSIRGKTLTIKPLMDSGYVRRTKLDFYTDELKASPGNVPENYPSGSSWDCGTDTSTYDHKFDAPTGKRGVTRFLAMSVRGQHGFSKTAANQMQAMTGQLMCRRIYSMRSRMSTWQPRWGKKPYVSDIRTLSANVGSDFQYFEQQYLQPEKVDPSAINP